MDEHFIISVGRQLGSGGHIIGKLLSEKFQIPFYDKELIGAAAAESGLSKEMFEQADEQVNPTSTGGLLSDYFQHNYFSNETLFQLQSDVIRNIASRESAVIMPFPDFCKGNLHFFKIDAPHRHPYRNRIDV